MNNSKRSVIFFIAFISVMYIFSFVMPNYDAYFNDTFRFVNGILFLILILYPAIQMIARWAYSTYGLKRDHTFFSLNIKENMIYYRLINIIFIGITLGYPVIQKLLNESLIPKYIMAICIWLIISEILIQITIRTTKAIFCHHQLIVKGIDMRIDLPFGDAVKSHSGVYSYKDFSFFTYNNGLLTLYLNNELGKLQLILSEDMSKQVTSYLGTKKIAFKEHYRV